MRMIKVLSLVLSLTLFIWLSVYSGSLVQAAKGDAKAGETIHKNQCLKCHGAQGKGDGPAAKILKVKMADWTDKEAMSKLSDDDLYKIIAKGGEAVGKAKQMPAYEGKLKEKEIRDVVAFVRSLSGK